jgi:hypothetical protein
MVIVVPVSGTSPSVEATLIPQGRLQWGEPDAPDH